MERTIKYPIGQQDFPAFSEEGALYADKTAYIEKMLRSGTLNQINREQHAR